MSSMCGSSKCLAFPEAVCQRLSCHDCSAAFLVSGVPVVTCNPASKRELLEAELTSGDGWDDTKNEKDDDESKSKESLGDSDGSLGDGGGGGGGGDSLGGADTSGGEEGVGSYREGSGGEDKESQMASIEGIQQGVSGPLAEPSSKAKGLVKLTAEMGKKTRHGPKGGCDPPVAYTDQMRLVRCVSPTLELRPGQVGLQTQDISYRILCCNRHRTVVENGYRTWQLSETHMYSRVAAQY